ncbi:ATP-binding protein [Bradyrhizobium diazoefficiens]|uniref:AlbA family DNA-binding domain-containing protein n=1 Tax=Bradyrhizobium diazoefficiens TaxID=1355477 RepID=UPI00190C9065|nr:ATP-binding protein [Bradyrhizobium diazoefficiens]MBK3660544.1 ATP-binding protein [Bradyrhizobium diazoefficiens]
MSLRGVALSAISEFDLQRLIQAQVPERRDIEYKANVYGGQDKDLSEFLADVSSFANTAGGDIIIGMTEQAGLPTALSALQIDADAEVLRLEASARTGLQPQIFGFAVQAVPITGGGHVLVLRIPRSYNQPHRVVRKGSNRFWARSSAGKYEPNVDELRGLFTRAPQLADRIRNFRFDRIAKIVGGDTPVPLMGSRPLVLHVAPLSAFDGSQSFRLDINQAPQQLFTAFSPIGGQAGDFRINIDGCLVLSNRGADGRSHRAYVQAYHNGIVEAVDSVFATGGGIGQNPDRLTSIRTEGTIVRESHAYLRSLVARDAAPPYVLLVSLIGVKGIPYSFAMEPGTLFEDQAGVLDRDQFHFAEQIIDDVPLDPYEYAICLRPLLDQIANAAGRARTPSFDQDGRFRVRI